MGALPAVVAAAGAGMQFFLSQPVYWNNTLPKKRLGVPEIGDYSLWNKKKRFKSFVPVPDTLLEKARQEHVDILVKNAGINGIDIIDTDGFSTMLLAVLDCDSLKVSRHGDKSIYKDKPSVREVVKESYELAEECLKTNYYGVKEVTEARIPFLQLSNSARIVNVSSTLGLLKNVSHEKAKEVLSCIDSLTDEKIKVVLNAYLKDFKEDI